MDEKKAEKKEVRSNGWSTRDPDLQQEIKRAQIPPKKFDPSELIK